MKRPVLPRLNFSNEIPLVYKPVEFINKDVASKCGVLKTSSSFRIYALLIALIVGSYGPNVFAQTNIFVGTGVVATGGSSGGAVAANAGPYGICVGSGNMGKKLQIIYTAAQINAAMTTAGYTPTTSFINSITWDVSQAIGTGNPNNIGYTIKMANAPALTTFATTGSQFAGAMTTVYGPTNTTFAAGTGFTQQFNLPTPFQWDGTSSLIVEVCYTVSGVGIIGAYGACRRTATAGNQMIYNGGATINCATGAYATLVAAIPNARLNVSPATPCSGAPSVSTAQTTTVCPGTSGSIGLTGLVGAAGYTYLWKYSATSGGPYTAAAGTNTNSTYATPTTLPSNPAYYICEVTCSNSGLMTPSNQGTVTLANFLTCYCTTGFSSAAATSVRGITNVNLAGNTVTLNNTTGANTANPSPYNLYASTVADLTAGLSYNLGTTVGSAAVQQHYVTVWIDYDQDGKFGGYSSLGVANPIGTYGVGGAILERLVIYGPVFNGLTNTNFTVPANATPGTTAMRVRYRYGASQVGWSACELYTGGATTGGAGEVEDYRVNIVAGCAAPTGATASSSSSITTTSAAIGWTNGSGTGGRIVILRQGSAVNASPVSGTNYTDNATFGSGDQLGTGNFVVYDGSGNSSGTISGLLPSTTYHYSIFEYNSASTCYVLTGNIGNFTTASCSPTLQPSLATICAEYDKVNVDVTRGNGTHMLIVARAGSAVNADPSYNTAYTANAAFGSGTQIGTGNFVVYNGNSAGTAALIMTALSPGVTYHFKAYEYNASPNCYNLVSPATFTSTTRSAGVYTSSTTTQVSTTVAQNSLSQQVVALQVIVGGGIDAAATMNSITFNTSGSTNVANDLVQARIFYTGTSSTFAATTQYGATFTSLAGNLTATDNFALATGTNYFWVVYDLKLNATIANVLDASIVSFNLTDNTGTSVKVPSVTAPAGSRTIVSSAPSGYCIPSPALEAVGDYITAPTWSGGDLGSSHTYGGGTNSGSGVINKTAQPAPTLTPGVTYTLSYYAEDFIGNTNSVWIDWDQTGTWNTTAPELVRNSGASFTVTQTVTVPLTALPGATRMRIINRFSTAGSNACVTSNGSSTSAVYVDYTVIIAGAVGVQAVSCATLKPTVTSPVNYNQGASTSALTATGVSKLWYTAASGGVGSATAPTPSSSIAGTTMYYVSQNTGCESPRTQVAVNVEATSCAVPATWEGDINSDWNTAGNWSSNVVPTASTDVTINAVVSPNVYPLILVGSNGVCRDLIMAASTSITIDASKSLAVLRHISSASNALIQGGGMLHMNGTIAQNINGSLTYPILRIENAAGVSVVSGTQTITLALQLRSGTFSTNNTVTLRSNATSTAYLDNFSAGFIGVLSGNITVQRFIPGGLGYRYFSSPISAASNLNVTHLGAFISGTNGVVFDPTNTPAAAGFPTCWVYNEDDANAIENPNAQWGWVSATNSSNLLSPMKGFALNLGGSTTISLTGIPSNGTVAPIAISNTPSSNPTSDGYNLIGNPYPSPISWNALRGLAPNTGQFSNVIKYWSNSGQYSGQYADYNGIVGTNGGGDIIPLGQAVMVRKTTPGIGSFNLANSARVASSSASFFEAEVVPNLIKLRISGGTGNDEMAIYFASNASNTFDENQDAVKMLSGVPGVPNIYSMNSDLRLSINAMGTLAQNTEIPLGVSITSAGNYTILASDFDSFEQTSLIYLEDRTLGVFHNLKMQNSVNVTLQVGDLSGRFFLHFSLPLNVVIHHETCQTNDGVIEVLNPSGHQWNVELLNSSEEIVSNAVISSNNWSSDLLSSGDFTIRLTTSDNYTVSIAANIAEAQPLNANFDVSSSNVFELDEVQFTSIDENQEADYTWIFGDGSFQNGSATTVHAYAEAGVYEAKLKVNYLHCEEIQSQTIVVTQDVTSTEYINNSGIKIYPNPAIDVISIELDAESTIEWIYIYDCSGRLVQSEFVSGMLKQNKFSLPVRDLSSGIYLMVLKSEYGNSAVRFNIQH